MIDIIHLIIIAPSIGYIGLNIYSNEKINENIGLIMILIAFLIIFTHSYIIYQKYKNNRLKDQ